MVYIKNNYVILKKSDVLTCSEWCNCDICLYHVLPRFKYNKQYVIETNASSFFKWEDAKRLLMFLVLICLLMRVSEPIPYN
jgi:hypothetical protein